MGKPDTLDRVAQMLIALVALIALANGALMLWNPYGWYQAIPTVKFTGPPNAHFIRDIGLAYVGSGMLLAYAVRNLSGRWLAATAGGLWLSAHGALHVWEVAVGVCAPGVFWRDAPVVIGPPLLVWIAIGLMALRQRISPAGIPKAAILSAIGKGSPDELACFKEIAGAPGHAFEKLTHFMPITMHRHKAPADLFHMARIGSTLVEDCGPCALTAARGAIADGVDRKIVNAALSGKPYDGYLRTGFDFGAAIAQHSAQAGELGDAIEAAYGRTVRLELAITAATVRAYPAMKRGLGLATPCAIAHRVV